MKNKKPLIGIIGGKGKLGNWFKIFFEKNGLEVAISGRKTKLSNIELAKMADIVIVSVPIKETSEVIREIRKHVRKNALLTDFTSIKTAPLKEMSKAESGVLGMHPLFGPLAPDLKNQSIVFCGKKDNDWTGYLKKLFERNGAKIVEISAEEHDKQMAFLQALLHFNNLNYSRALSLKKFKSLPEFLTPIFRLQSLVLGRILSQNPGMYASIEMENPYFVKILRDYHNEVSSLKNIVEKKNYKEFENRFRESQKFFSGFIKTAEEKTSEILKMMDKQPVKIGKPEKIDFKKGRVGFLGPEGTFSWKAAKEIFPNSVSLTPFPNIKEILKSVAEGDADLGVIPVENNLTGLVSETIHSFVGSPVFAIGSFKIAIHHCIASRGKDLKNIKIIKTHPQPLSQCKKWLEKNLPMALQETASSTIAPIMNDFSKTTAFILPLESAKKFNLNILAKNIEDSKDNFTRFFIITNKLRNGISKKLHSKNTLLLLAAYDKPGVLKDILNVFAKREINLSAIHSIRSYSQPWDYMFFLEVEKSCRSKDFKKIWNELEKYCPYSKIIGAV